MHSKWDWPTCGCLATSSNSVSLFLWRVPLWVIKINRRHSLSFLFVFFRGVLLAERSGGLAGRCLSVLSHSLSLRAVVASPSVPTSTPRAYHNNETFRGAFFWFYVDFPQFPLYFFLFVFSISFSGELNYYFEWKYALVGTYFLRLSSEPLNSLYLSYVVD